MKKPMNAFVSMHKPQNKDLPNSAHGDIRKAIAKQATRQFDKVAARGRISQADALNDVKALFEESMARLLAGEDATPELKRRIECLSLLSRVLPNIQTAEANARVSIRKKAVSELTNDELMLLMKETVATPEPSLPEPKEVGVGVEHEG